MWSFASGSSVLAACEPVHASPYPMLHSLLPCSARVSQLAREWRLAVLRCSVLSCAHAAVCCRQLQWFAMVAVCCASWLIAPLGPSQSENINLRHVRAAHAHARPRAPTRAKHASVQDAVEGLVDDHLLRERLRLACAAHARLC